MSTIKVTAINANIGASTITIAPGGATGPQGPAGEGVAVGGTAGQALVKIDGTDYNTEWADVASTADAVSVTDAGGYFTGTDVEAVLQEIGATPGLEGWEIAQLTEGTGGTIWSDNKTELQRAYATGDPVYVPPGTYEIDDCVLSGQTNCVIWADQVTFKWAADPSIGVRATESMIEIGQNHTNLEIRGAVTFDGNEGSSYTVVPVSGSGYNTMFYVDSDNSGTLGHFIIDDITFKDVAYNAFTMMTTTQAEDWTYGIVGSIRLIDAMGVIGARFRTRLTEGIKVGELYSIETGGDKPNKWNDIGYTDMRAAWAFELGEVAIESTHTEYLHIDKIYAKYPKYSIFGGGTGVKSTYVGDYIAEKALWNEDGTDATMSSPGALMYKNGSSVVSDVVRSSYKVHIDRLIVKGTNNGKAIPLQGGGTDLFDYSFELDDESIRHHIGYFESDADVNLGRDSNSAEERSGEITIDTLYWHGAAEFQGELDILNKTTIGHLIISDLYDLSGETRTRIIFVRDEVKINSITALNDVSFFMTIKGTPLRNQETVIGWWNKSNISISNADFGANGVLSIELRATTATNPYDQQEATVNASVYPEYLKARFDNCVIPKMTHNTRFDASFITDFADFRDRVQLIFVGCSLRDAATRPTKAILTNATTGLLSTNNTFGGTIDVTDDVVGATVEAGTKDLPSDVTIGASRFIRTSWNLNSENVDDSYNFINGWGDGSAVPSGYSVSWGAASYAPGETSASFTVSSAPIPTVASYTISTSGGATEVTGTQLITAASTVFSSIDLSSLEEGVLTLSVTLESPSGVGDAVTDTADYLAVSILQDTAAAVLAYEANNTTGWVDGASRGCTIAVETTEVNSSTYSLKLTDTEANNGFIRAEFSLTVLDATTYDVSYDYKVLAASTDTMGLTSWGGVVTSPQTDWNEDGTWRTDTFQVTTNSTTMVMRFYVKKGANTAGAFASAVIDNLSITPA